MKNKYLIILSIFLLIASIILIKPTKKVKLDNVVLKQEVNNKTFAMYKEEGESYVPVEGTDFPEGYVLNIRESKCIDNNGNEIKDALSYENGNVIITSGNTIYCYLYFDKARTYILMAQEGMLKEPDTKLVNMLGEEGNFEKDSDFHKYYNSNNNHNNSPDSYMVYCDFIEDNAKYGIKACKLSSSEHWPERTIATKSDYKLDNSHMYYAQVSYYVQLKEPYELSVESIQFFWPIAEPNLGLINIQELAKWRVAGAINDRVTFENEESPLRMDFNFVRGRENNYAEIIFDGAMLIDLTESYGENYPTLEELNQLYYFDNSIETKKVIDKNGIFELNNEISKIECNNDASWEIDNSKIAIKSKEEYTVCIIRE